ncbi:MAG TPA: SDR family oxidoreductase [Candidatus Nanoarchaeia archaeon]|nr:SDR family oxidoreductase [Candidatus Nanoarchaeia archaeon]
MKIALVTGAAKGLGRAIAVALAKEGYHVLVHYRKSKEDAEETLAQVKQYGSGTLAQGDLLNAEDIAAIFATIRNLYHRLDVLVNIVGDFHFAAMQHTTVQDLDAVYCSNVLTMFSCVQEALPIMHSQDFGKIITFGAAGCDRLMLREKTTPYYAAKSTVLSLTKVLAGEEMRRNSGVTLNCISPGILETSIAKPEGAPIVPLRDVVQAVMNLINSDQNGQNITVSKGWLPENQY